MEKMLLRFESKSSRVKGLSFHPIRPWILASLHNGQIQLWDYRMGTCIDKFEEHDGPVRGIDFHRVQPLFVSGGDDYKVKVWDYKLRRCLFTLLGHLDYIRTVKFHHEYPWIVSASDDQTIRIWNWQSRSCISVLTGHNHYVMCASFHPKEDLIVSGSLDQTVRVWDTTGLRKKTVRGPPVQMDDNNVVTRVNNELFGGNDALVKHVLEGHERGVNWATFHPSLPLVVSGADDRQVKLWRMSDTKAWEVDTMRGHTNNVSCVLFHPKYEIIISNSEDRTIRVWDIPKRLCVHTFRKENDRFWILAVHPEQNLLAAGHDSGMIVFKLERERPPYDYCDNKCFYIKDRGIRQIDFTTNKDTPLVGFRRPTANFTPGVGGGPRALFYNSFNKSEHNVLVLHSQESEGSYDLLTITSDSIASGEAQDIRRGTAIAAVFIGRNKFITLDKFRRLTIKNMQNEMVKQISPAAAAVTGLFPGGVSGNVILKYDDHVSLYDTQAQRVIADLEVPRVRYVYWNKDCSMIALISKHHLVIANKNFEQLSSSYETVRLKSGCWDPHRPIFIYTTLNHVKYALANGDKGILRGLECPVYATRIVDNVLHCFDREGKIRTIEVDLTEALFKLALEMKNYPEVMRLVKNSRLCGQAILAYLQEKGYPEVALHFVHDPKTRFKLALACGNIQVAMNVAHEIGDEAWKQLGVEALRQGNHEVVEMSYQKTKDFEKLSFLYLITGNTEKLRKMLRIAEMRGDVMSRFHNALYLGDAEERVRVFEATNNLSLAYLTAAVHGLDDTAARLRELSEATSTPIPIFNENAPLLQPPTAIIRSENWPLLAIGKTAFSTDFSATAGGSGSGGVSSLAMNDDDDSFHDAEEGNKWGDDDDLFDDEEDAKKKPKKVVAEASEGGAGWGDDDLDLSDDDEDVPTGSGSGVSSAAEFSMIAAGPSPTASWCSESSHAADHFAAGSVDSAAQLLNRQIAASNILAVKKQATSLFLGSMAFLPGIPSVPCLRVPLVREVESKGHGKVVTSLPALALRLPPLLEELKVAYKCFTNAQFNECKSLLEVILLSIPLVAVGSRQESNDLKELKDVCREYLTALRIKNAISDAEDNISRTLELSAYFTHCHLQPAHLMLALKTAMATAFKNKVLFLSFFFARRYAIFSLFCNHTNIYIYMFLL